jgi:hypothetical protein
MDLAASSVVEYRTRENLGTRAFRPVYAARRNLALEQRALTASAGQHEAVSVLFREVDDQTVRNRNEARLQSIPTPQKERPRRESDNTRTAPAALGAFRAGRLESLSVEEKRSYWPDQVAML